jgi:L-amino acid N-acyltransferase YncA
VNLRFASLRDAEELVATYAPIVETTAISFEAVAPDAAEMQLRLASQPANKPWIVTETAGALDVPQHDPLDITALDPSAVRAAFAQ